MIFPAITPPESKSEEYDSSHPSGVIFPASSSSVGCCQAQDGPPPLIPRDPAHCAAETVLKNERSHSLSAKSVLCTLETCHLRSYVINTTKYVIHFQLILVHLLSCHFLTIPHTRISAFFLNNQFLMCTLL